MSIDLRAELRASSSADRKLMQTWLHGRSPETQRAYLREAVEFLSDVQKPLSSVTLADLQAYQDGLEAQDYSPRSVSRRLSTIKSLLAFGQKTGALQFNVGAALRLPAADDTIADRILSEADVLRLIDRQAGRNRVLLRTLYAAALRASEAARLRKRDVIEHSKGGVLSVWGKGKKPRVVRVSPATFAELVRYIPGDLDSDDIVFGITSRQICRVVKQAAADAGLPAKVSPHWLRHAHASHALDRGAPIHLVQQTLGHRSVNTTGAYLHARPNDSSALYLAV